MRRKISLRRGEADRRRVLLAPPEEATHRDAKVQEMLEILLGRLNELPSSAETSEIHRNPTNLLGGRPARVLARHAELREILNYWASALNETAVADSGGRIAPLTFPGCSFSLRFWGVAGFA